MKFYLQRFGGSTSVSNTSSYTPSEYELDLQKTQSEIAKKYSPNASWLNDVARNLLQGSIGTVQQDFNELNQNAQNQIAASIQGLSDIIGSNTNAADRANQALSDYGNFFNQYTADTNNNLQNISDSMGDNANNTNNRLNGLEDIIKGTTGDSLNQLKDSIGVRDNATQTTNNELDEHKGNFNNTFTTLYNALTGNTSAADGATPTEDSIMGKYSADTEDLAQKLTGDNGLIQDYQNAVSNADKTGVNDILSQYLNGENGASFQKFLEGIRPATEDAKASLSDLQNGVLSSNYTNNMTDAIRSAMQNTIGDTMNNLAQRGVLNSSVTNTAINDIEKNVADTLAQNYLNNISTVQGLTQDKFEDALRASQIGADLLGDQTNLAQQMFENKTGELANTNNLYQQAYNARTGSYNTLADMWNTLYGDSRDNIQSQVDLAQSQLNNTMAKTAANDDAAMNIFNGALNETNSLSNLYQQQYANSADALQNQANLTQNQYSNTANTANTLGDWANRQYSNTLGANSANANIYSNVGIGQATAPITTAAAAQEAAQTPATNLWNASLGLTNSNNSALAAAAGKGTTTSTQTQSGGGLLSGLFGGLF